MQFKCEFLNFIREKLMQNLSVQSILKIIVYCLWGHINNNNKKKTLTTVYIKSCNNQFVRQFTVLVQCAQNYTFTLIFVTTGGWPQY